MSSKPPNVFWHGSAGKRLQPRSEGDHARQKQRRGLAAEGRGQSDQKAPHISISDASLNAVQAHREGVTPAELLNYLLREFGMTVRPNHLGAALQRHRRAGQLENRDQRWYLPS